ncbi:MAG TPA: hypothetical protein VK661_06985 [Planctomycetota bacterium]|nr:hypothetical protein [Planctomycetota bacterium]
MPLAALLQALHRRASRRGNYGPDGEPPDPLLMGATSPSLERYRLARALAAERENRVADGALVDRVHMARCLEEIGRLQRVEVEAVYLARPETKGAFDVVLNRAKAAFLEWVRLNPEPGTNGNGSWKERGGHEAETPDHRDGRVGEAETVGQEPPKKPRG